MQKLDWIQRFKDEHFGGAFKLAFSALLPAAFFLVVTWFLQLIVSIPATFFFAKWINEGMLIINEYPDFTQIDPNAGPWAIISEMFTFQFSEGSIYTVVLAIAWLFFTYLFFLGYIHQVMFRIFESKISDSSFRLFSIMLRSFNGKSIQIAFLLGIISLMTYIPVLLIQSFIPNSLLLMFAAQMLYFLLLIKLMISPVVYTLGKVANIPQALEYSWTSIKWSSAFKILAFAFGFFMFLIVFFFFASLVFAGTSIAVPRFAVPAFLFFMLMGVYVLTLIIAAQFALYYRYLPIVEEVQEPEVLDSESEADNGDDYYFPEYDDEGDKLNP